MAKTEGYEFKWLPPGEKLDVDVAIMRLKEDMLRQMMISAELLQGDGSSNRALAEDAQRLFALRFWGRR